MLYLDTNVYLYLTNKTSPFHSTCKDFIKACQLKNIEVVTSVETLQEIIHFAKNTKQLKKGIETAKIAIEKSNYMLGIDTEIISMYLSLIQKYRTVDSRDALHLAVCIINKIDTIISYDADFKKFKEIKTKTPEEFLKSKKFS